MPGAPLWVPEGRRREGCVCKEENCQQIPFGLGTQRAKTAFSLQVTPEKGRLPSVFWAEVYIRLALLQTAGTLVRESLYPGGAALFHGRGVFHRDEAPARHPSPKTAEGVAAKRPRLTLGSSWKLSQVWDYLDSPALSLWERGARCRHGASASGLEGNCYCKRKSTLKQPCMGFVPQLEAKSTVGRAVHGALSGLPGQPDATGDSWAEKPDSREPAAAFPPRGHCPILVFPLGSRCPTTSLFPSSLK